MDYKLLAKAVTVPICYQSLDDFSNDLIPYKSMKTVEVVRNACAFMNNSRFNITLHHNE